MKDLRSLNLTDLLACRLENRGKAEKLLADIQEAISKAQEGADLSSVIHKVLCESSVTDIEVYHLFICAQKCVVPTGD